jgi:hypothetical protein
MYLEQRAGSLDEFIEVLKETYNQLPPAAWEEFKDQVVAIGKLCGTVTLKYDVNVETNTITVSVAQLN